MKKTFLWLWITAVLVMSITARMEAADVKAVLDSADGTSTFVVQDSTPTTMISFDSDGNVVIKGGVRLDSAGVENTTAEDLIVDGNVAIGTTSINGKLTVEGVVSLDETTAPSATAGYGKVYVKSSDSNLYFLKGGGSEVGLTLSSEFSVHKNGTDQTGVATTTLTKVTWSTERFDTNNDFDTTNDRFTPTIAGKYILIAAVIINNVPNGSGMSAYIYKNGSLYASGSYSTNGSLMRNGSLVSIVVDANGSTDYFEVYVWHNIGSNGTVEGDSIYTHFSGALIGP